MLTDRQFLELAKLSYLFVDALGYFRDELENNLTLKEFAITLLTEKIEDKDGKPIPIPFVDPARKTKENAYLFTKEFRDTLNFIINDPILSELEFIEYVNRNRYGEDDEGSGFGRDNNSFALPLDPNTSSVI